MVDEQNLRQLAEAATPGPWIHWQSGGIHQIDAAKTTVVHWSGFDQLQTPNEKTAIKNNAAYIAAANPAAILSLLDELQTLRSERTAWRVTAENAEKDAARYRWLRAQNWEENRLGVVVRPKDNTKLGCFLPSDTLLDDTIDHMSTIDAAMKEES